MTKLRQALALADGALTFVAKLTMFAMMLSISADALGRYLFNRPLQGNVEMTSLYMMVILGFLGLSIAHRRQDHIQLDVFIRRFKPSVQRVVAVANALIAMVFFAALTWWSGEVALEKLVERQTTYGAQQFPLYLSYCWVPLGTAVLTLQLIIDALVGITGRDFDA